MNSSIPHATINHVGLSDSPQNGRPTVGALLRTRRRQLGWSLQVLGEKANCTRSYICSIEKERRPYPPSAEVLRRLEDALLLNPGDLTSLASWQRTPAEMQREMSRLTDQQRAARRLADLLRADAAAREGGPKLDELYKTGELKRLIERIDPGIATARPPGVLAERSQALMPVEVPLINSVAAGYPREFTDLGYPARAADEYVRTPDIRDPDAFAARVVGDSMEPEYHEGDIVVFSPARKITKGAGFDCFVRLERDHETTFKRVFFEYGPKGVELVRLQPLNPRYPARTIPREEVAGCYAAVSVTRTIGPRL